MPVAVQVERPVVGQKLAHDDQALVHELQVLVVYPDVRILLFLKDTYIVRDFATPQAESFSCNQL